MFYGKLMGCFLFSYAGSSRELKRIIVSLLKSWCASKVQKLNYVQNFWINWSNIEKSEIKYIVVYSDDESKLLNFLSKNFSEVERIVIK